MIANRHGVIAEAVHHLRSGAAFIISVEQRALELIAGIKQHNIIGRTADVRDGPGETAMHIIGVQNGEVERTAERRCARG